MTRVADLVGTRRAVPRLLSFSQKWFVVWFLFSTANSVLDLLSGDPFRDWLRGVAFFSPLLWGALLFGSLMYETDTRIRVYPRRRGDHREYVRQNRVTWSSSIVTFLLGAVVGHYWR